MKKDPKDFKYESRDVEWLVPVYRTRINPDKPREYGELEVVGLASISNPSEPLEEIYFVSPS